MINGFIVEIKNTLAIEQTVLLFKEGGMPKGITVLSKGTTYDYDSLLSLSKREGFKGSGIITDDFEVNQLTIFTENNATQHHFSKIHEESIFLDGITKYISLVIPSCKTVLIQLAPLF